MQRHQRIPAIGRMALTLIGRWDIPEKIVDFGNRAIHEMTLKAKLVIQAFYGDAPKHSYFASCSNGGRQALMEAQRFPDDYDGILAGAPANYWTHLLITNFYASGKPMLEDHASLHSEREDSGYCECCAGQMRCGGWFERWDFE